MSKSLIRTLIAEAANDPEVVSVPDDTQEDAQPAATPMEIPQVPDAALQSGAGDPTSAKSLDLNFTQQIPSTINKKVINKELIIAVLSELKSSITNYQKKFESEDMDIRDADIYLTNFINSSIYQLKKLNDFITGDEGNAIYKEGQD